MNIECVVCNGMGEVREFIAQDESHLVICNKCKGEKFIKMELTNHHDYDTVL